MTSSPDGHDVVVVEDVGSPSNLESSSELGLELSPSTPSPGLSAFSDRSAFSPSSTCSVAEDAPGACSLPAEVREQLQEEASYLEESTFCCFESLVVRGLTLCES